MSRHRVVFSTDQKDKCPRCGWLKDDCRCAKEEERSDKAYTVVFRLEKNGRGGKTVTVMDGWPKNEAFLKDMTKELKSKCGTGGTYFLEAGKATIEIQGDKRDQLKKLLEAKKIPFKGH